MLLCALVACSHLLGRYAVKLLDFLLENIMYRQVILSDEIDPDGNLMLHLLCNNNTPDDVGDITTTSLLIDQLRQRHAEFTRAVCCPNHDGNLPLHMLLLSSQNNNNLVILYNQC